MAPVSPMARVSPARACAYAVVRRVFEQDAYADRAFHAEARRLEGRERSFAMALAYGTVQRKATLDHVLTQLSDRSPDKLDAPVLAALRLGLMQVLLLDGVAEHAAVHESVELAKRHGRGGSGLVNAVLRRAVREGRQILAGLDDDSPAGAAVKHSVPTWLAELWWRELGAERARALLAVVNQPAESAVRVNTLTAAPATVAAALGIASDPAPGIPEGLVLAEPFDAYGSPQWARGELMPQSRGSMLVGRTLAPEPGERVLDLCAAPGAKTTHLAALMGDEGEIVAVERHPGRAQALRHTLERMHVHGATVQVGDAARGEGGVDRSGVGGVGLPGAGGVGLPGVGGVGLPGVGGVGLPGVGGVGLRGAGLGGDLRGGYDRVLVDPPCSGLGTLQSRPDLRWRTSPARIADLAPQQYRILAAGAAATRPGGVLVYSVCTISRAESDDVVERFVAEHPDWEAEPYRRSAPDTDGTDGFFIATLRRH